MLMQTAAFMQQHWTTKVSLLSCILCQTTLSKSNESSIGTDWTWYRAGLSQISVPVALSK